MNAFFLVPVAVGIAVVLQGGFNRQISTQWGLAMAVFLNAVVFLLAAAALVAWAKWRPEQVPELMRLPATPGPLWHWKVLLPGVLGLVIVAGLPLAFVRLGALQVILGVLVAQLVASLLWDAWVEGIPPHPVRIAGTLVALGGALLASWKTG